MILLFVLLLFEITVTYLSAMTGLGYNNHRDLRRTDPLLKRDCSARFAAVVAGAVMDFLRVDAACYNSNAVEMSVETWGIAGEWVWWTRRRSTYSCVHCSGEAGRMGAGVTLVSFLSVLLGSILVSDGGGLDSAGNIDELLRGCNVVMDAGGAVMVGVQPGVGCDV